MQEKGNSAMLHDNKNISHLIVVLQRISLIFKTSLGSKRVFITNFLQNYLILWMIECLTLSLKRVGILVDQPRIQLVECVARIVMVIA